MNTLYINEMLSATASDCKSVKFVPISLLILVALVKVIIIGNITGNKIQDVIVVASLKSILLYLNISLPILLGSLSTFVLLTEFFLF